MTHLIKKEEGVDVDNDFVTMDNRYIIPVMIEIINEGCDRFILARGYSMRPFIEDKRDGLVFSKIDDLSSLKVGDVVLAEIHKGHFVCHRIKNISNGVVTMRGDGNLRDDVPFPIDNVKVRLTKIIKNLKIDKLREAKDNEIDFMLNGGYGKVYDLDTSKVWKCYSAVWTRLELPRRYLLAAYRLMLKITK